jgi:hypothetical protein
MAEYARSSALVPDPTTSKVTVSIRIFPVAPSTLAPLKVMVPLEAFAVFTVPVKPEGGCPMMV